MAKKRLTKVSKALLERVNMKIALNETALNALIYEIQKQEKQAEEYRGAISALKDIRSEILG